MYIEGKAKISATTGAFLNPQGRVSRDISAAYVGVTRAKAQNLLDATAATGIRGIRYYLESGIRDLTMLEINETAYSDLKKNVAKNKVKAKPLNTSIQEFANTSKERFNFIDLDPFGGVNAYVYDLMKISTDGTELMITATDTAVLCGADSKACMRLYDSKPVHNELSHEGGLRVLIAYVARQAAQFNFGVEVKLSLSYLHYMRAFVRLSHGSKSATDSISQLGYLQYCQHCGSMRTEESFVPRPNKCANCGKETGTYGRMWLGPIKDDKIAVKINERIIKQKYSEAAVKLSATIKDELSTRFYYHIPTVTKRLRIGAVSHFAVMEKLSDIGYKSSTTHMQGSSVKTDAALSDVISCVKASVKRG